jgi:hypothetical protein
MLRNFEDLIFTITCEEDENEEELNTSKNKEINIE